MTPHDKQVMMFSATLSKEIRPICKKFMSDVSAPHGAAAAATPAPLPTLLPAACSSCCSPPAQQQLRSALQCLTGIASRCSIQGCDSSVRVSGHCMSRAAPPVH